MTLFVLAAVTAVVLAVVFRGRPSTFSRPTVHRFGLLGIVVIGLATSPLAKSTGVYAGWLIVAAIAVGWFMALNRGRPGLGLAIGGLALNAVVILLNSGMPVSLAAVERAGVPLSRVPLDTDPLREELTTETTLSWLGEAVPLALPIRPAVVSPGDVLVAAGGALFLFTGLTGFGRAVPDRELTLAERKTQRAARKARKAAKTEAGPVGSTPQTPSVLGWPDEDMRAAAATAGTQPEDVEPDVERATSELPVSGLTTGDMPTRELPTRELPTRELPTRELSTRELPEAPSASPEAPSASPDAPALVGSSDNGAGPPAVDDDPAAVAAAAERARLRKIKRQQKRERKQKIAAQLAQSASDEAGDTQNGDTQGRNTEDDDDQGATLPAAKANQHLS
ncbi:MAG: DUF5317 domain-containing protein [Actinomycetes bacterium]